MSETKTTKRKAKLEKKEIVNLVEMFADLMNAYGSFSENLGKIQKTHKETYEEMFSLEAAEKIPEMLSKIVAEGPSELSSLFVRIFAKMTTFLPRVNKMMELSAEEKIKLGKNLKSLAKDFGKLLEWVEKKEE